MFEHLLGNQITTKYDDRLGDRLTAYRKHNSCETSLIGLVGDWKFRLLVEILSTDMSKAFDSLHPPLILCKLKAYRFQDRALDLLHSYLCSHLGRVRIGSVTGSWRNGEQGCPQGSVIGPLLWNIFQNDLSHNLGSGLSMYADDHQIYMKGKDVYYCHKTSNLLQGNLKKYQLMNIRNKSVDYGDKTSITINGKDIMESDNLELLGVTIDGGLNFNLHISNVCKKASQRIGVIMRLRNLIPTEAKLHLFKAAILPHLTYCHLVWHFCRALDTCGLERVQERGLCAVFNDKQSSHQQLLVKAKLPSLYNRRLQDMCILMYEVKHNLCPRTICDMFLTNSHNLPLKDFYHPSFNTVTHGKHSM